MFESRISAGATENSPGQEKPHAKTVAWSYDMEGHAQKVVERYCELANKKKQMYNVSTACLDNHNFKKGELETVGELSDVFHKSSSHACAWHELVDLTFFGQNKLARAVTKWTQACDRRLARWISYIHHTNDFRQYCHVGNTVQQCRLG